MWAFIGTKRSASLKGGAGRSVASIGPLALAAPQKKARRHEPLNPETPPRDDSDPARPTPTKLERRKGAILPLFHDGTSPIIAAEALRCSRPVGRARHSIQQRARQVSKASTMDHTAEDFDATMKTTIYAPLWIIRAALPHLNAGACRGRRRESSCGGMPPFMAARAVMKPS